MPPKPYSIATLNTRSIQKLTNPTNFTSFTTHLRSLSHSILALTETNTSNLNERDEQKLKLSLGAKEAIWTQHCGLVLRDRDFSISSSFSSKDGRALFASISTPDPATSLSLCVVYAPSSGSEERRRFFDKLLLLPFFTDPLPHSVILGDFNYHHHQPNSCPADWRAWTDIHLRNVITRRDVPPLPTWQQGRARTTVDYIFASHDFLDCTSAPHIDFINPTWSDHAILSTTVTLAGDGGLGPGVWRLNTSILTNQDFRYKLEATLDKLLLFQAPTIQLLWDQVKEGLKRFLLNYTKWHQKELRRWRTRLQEKRVHLLKDLNDTTNTPVQLADLHGRLAQIEAEITEDQEKKAEGYAVRSGLKWLEKGERSSSYFFATLKDRLKRRTMEALFDPDTQTLATTSATMIPCAVTFYSNLFTPTPVYPQHIQHLLARLPPNQRLSDAQQLTMASPPTPAELDAILSKSPRGRSPGLDGLPFEVYDMLLAHAPTCLLFEQVLEEAVLLSRFPPSWKNTVMVLLFKKGEATLLENWRPLSLINVDAKIFTKLLTNRLRNMMPTLLGRHQTGFVKDRSILDNGLTMQALMDWAKVHKLPHVCVLLDQAKAYDRIHPEFLRATLVHMNFPPAFITSISNLFFSTNVHLNINGHIADPFPQLRGLRQGDPLSPLLFNLAFEVFLAVVQSSAQISGIKINNDLFIKLLAYADDLAVFISTYIEWVVLEGAFREYGLASNALLNVSKTVVFPMRPGIHPLKAAFQFHGIEWYDEDSEQPQKYLGFPIVCHLRQRNQFFDALLNKIKIAINIHSQRQLSVAGRALIINALLLSRLWHVLRVHSPTQSWIKKLRTAIRGFALPFKPCPSMDTAELPKKKGGLGIINVRKQETIFHITILQHLLSDSTALSMVLLRSLMEVRTGEQCWISVVLDPHRERYHQRLQSFSTINNLLTTIQEHLILTPQLPLPANPVNLKECLKETRIGATIFAEMDKKQWRDHLYNHVSDTLTVASSAFWKAFWNDLVPHNSRNILWRYLDGKLSNKARLHRLWPHIAPSPNCSDCNAIEDQDHFLVTCPTKSAIWQAVLAEHTTKNIWSDRSILSLLSPTPIQFDMGVANPLSKRQLVAAIVTGIWSHHWTQHFEDSLFEEVAGKNIVNANIRRLQLQVLYRNNPS